MKSAKEIAELHILLQNGWSKRMIASWLGISRNTVERYLSLSERQSTSTDTGATKLERCLEWLAEQEERIKDGSEILRQRLDKERKIKVSRRTMQRAIKSMQEEEAQRNKRMMVEKEEDPKNKSPTEVVLGAPGWKIGPYRLSCGGELYLADSRIKIAAAQMQLLLMFARRPNQLITQKEIATQLWPERKGADNRARCIRLCIHRLRQVFVSGPLGGDVIRSVYRKGYVFDATVESAVQSCQSEIKAKPAREGNEQMNSYKRIGEPSQENPFYSEVHDYWPNRDPYKLQRQETLLQKSVVHDPRFEQGYLELCYIQLLQCFWGMRSSEDVLSTLQQQLDTIQELKLKPAGWLGIKAEVQSLLLWQPSTTHRLYGTWLAQTLPRGMPLLAWTRHLIFTGKPKTAVRLLRAQVSENLCQGWLSLAMAYCAIGNFGAAEEAIESQLKIEPSMVGPRLFLALLLAKRGESDVSAKLVFDTGLLDRPFQGVQALAACCLAQGAYIQRAHQLLDVALETINASPSKAGAIGYWGLAALELERHREATQLLKLSVQHRCYSAPVLFGTPFIKAYANTYSYRLFTERMQKSFLIHH